MMDRAILISIFSFAFGVFVSSFVFVSPIICLYLFVVAVGILSAEKVWNGKAGKEASILFLVLIFFSLGSLRYDIKDFHELVYPLNTGIVVSESEDKENVKSFVFKSDNGEKALVSTDIYSPVRYGDRVEIKAEFERPEAFDGFDYPAYLSKDDIYYVASFAEVRVVESGRGNPIKSTLFKLKGSFIERIKSIFAEPYASLMSGLLVAGKEGMPKSIVEEFRRAGIVHIVVLSGYNITIIADFLRKFFARIFLLSPKTSMPWLASGASVAGILLFVLMTGAQATVVRAAIMVLTVILAKSLGRKYSAPRALLLAAFVMLLENPKILVFDPSFELSFLATLALIYVVPIVRKYLRFIPDRLELRTMISTTLGTQLAVLPLLTYSMGNISLVSLVANVLVLPIIPLTMGLGFMAALLSYLGGIIALPVAYIAHLFLAWILGVASFFGNMKLASVDVSAFPIWLVLLIYLLLFFFVRLSRYGKP